MGVYSEGLSCARLRNQRALKAFGTSSDPGSASLCREVRSGNGVRVLTIGYERRSGAQLINDLQTSGAEMVVDVRERPFSRKADFRERALRETCTEAGLVYESWTRLGSTAHQREQLRESGDLATFRRRFRDFARRHRSSELDLLAKVAKRSTVALLCYERVHEQCHRSIVSDLLADRINATIIAVI